jgi:hypothetical protein
MIDEDARNAIDGADYPLTAAELIEQCGDRSLGVGDGTECVGDALEVFDADAETFETPEEARLAVYSGISEEAVERRGYSDRDPTPPGSPYGPEQVSF